LAAPDFMAKETGYAMITMLANVLRGIDKLSENSGKLFSLLVIPIIVLEAGESLLRYIFQMPTDWTWELAAMLFGAFFMMGGAWVLKDQNHVRTDVFYNKLSRKWKAYFDLFFFTTVFFVFAAVMVWKMGANAMYSVSIKESTFSMWAPPLYPLKIVFAFAYILLFLQGLAKWVRDLVYVVKGVEI
jgi:TRAP-type mannitol/chloroaromatic compound transport system permease small subunit